MSHLVKKACTLADLQTILDAAKALGWLITENERAKFFAGYSEVCEYVLHPDNELNDRGDALRYTIGVKVEADGMKLLYDNAMNSRDVLYGDDEDSCTQRIIGKLKASYQNVAVKKVALKKRWRVNEQVKADGKIVLTIKV